MKNKILALALVIVMLISSAAITTSALDAPTPGGKNLFAVADIMYTGDPGTKFHNAFANTVQVTPAGKTERWHGANFEETTYNGVHCVAVSIIDDTPTASPVLDFNYYQWDSEYYNPSLDATKYKWFKIKYAYNEAGSSMDYIKFYASKDVTPLGVSNLKNGYKNVDIVNGDGEWQEVIFNLSDIIFEDGTMWDENTIRQFRVQMFEYNEDLDAVCYIAGFGFFETEEEAKAWDYTSDGPTAPPTIVTEAKTEAPTEAATEAPTEAKTEAPTEAPTEAKTEAPTEAKTEAPTEADTEATEEDTEATEPVDAPAEEAGAPVGIIIAVVAAIAVIAIVAVVLSKKKAAK